MSDRTPDSSQIFEMKEPVRVVVGMCILFPMLFAFLFGFVALAISNLLHPHYAPWKSLIASVLWLVLVGAIVIGSCRMVGGIRAMLVRMLGCFARKQFMRIDRQDSTDSAKPLVCLGFHLLGKDFYYRKVELDGITQVNWSPGQGTSRLGRDIDDWSVAMWYERDAVRSTIAPSLLKDEKELDIIGHEGPRESTERFGRSLVEFLRAGGAMLVPDPEGTKFVRQMSE